MLRHMVQIVITRPAKISPAWLPILTVSSIFYESQTRLPNVLSSYFEPSILLTLPVYQRERLPCQMAGILAFMVNGEHKSQKGEQTCLRLHHKWGVGQGTHFESRFSPPQTVLCIFLVTGCPCLSLHVPGSWAFPPPKTSLFLHSCIPWTWNEPTTIFLIIKIPVFPPACL